MKRVYYIAIAILIAVILNSRYSSAAMKEQLIKEDAIISVVQERQKARQEYQIYKAKQTESVKEAAKSSFLPASLPDNGYAKRRNDLFIGIAFIIVAIILTIWLLQFSKKNRANNAKFS